MLGLGDCVSVMVSGVGGMGVGVGSAPPGVTQVFCPEIPRPMS